MNRDLQRKIENLEARSNELKEHSRKIKTALGILKKIIDRDHQIEYLCTKLEELQ